MLSLSPIPDFAKSPQNQMGKKKKKNAIAAASAGSKQKKKKTTTTTRKGTAAYAPLFRNHFRISPIPKPRPYRDWSKLPSDLLHLVSNRLTDVADYIRFRAVCTRWRSAASPADLPPQLPWLLLPYNPEDSIRRFYSLSTRKIYRFLLPTTRGRAIYTSPRGGWLLMTDSHLSLSLLHVFTRAQIHLPPVSTPFPHDDDCDDFLRTRDDMVYKEFRRLNRHLQMFMMPIIFRVYPFQAYSGEMIVALVIAESPQFMYCRLHDTAWVKPEAASESAINTVQYYMGRFYILHDNGDVAVCELGAGATPTLIPSLRVPCKFACCYLAELDEELLLVTSTYSTAEKMEIFSYFWLDMIGELKWSKMHGIGDHALFLAVAENVIVAEVGDAAGCTRNYVYKNVSHNYAWSSTSPVHQLDVVSVDDGSVNLLPLFFEEYRYDLTRATWFTPSLC